MGTCARVKLMVDDQCIRQLYMSMDGYPSNAGRQILAAVVPLTTSPLAHILAVFERLVQDGTFKNPPPFLTEAYPCDYTYEFRLHTNGMQFYLQHYHETKVLVYEEEFLRQGDEIWKRIIQYESSLFF